VGQQRALAFALGGEPLDAQTALRWGLVTDVADDADARGRELVQALASRQPQALGRTRQLLRASAEATRAETGAREARTIAERVGSEEAQAQLARFVPG